MQTVTEFGAAARDLARNPLGIIALFIVLLYGFASLVLGFSDRLADSERAVLVWFLVLFPPLVLLVFAWLVSRHHTKLYAPQDYRSDATFIEASRRQAAFAVALGAATSQGKAAGPPTEDAIRKTRDAVDLVVESVRPQTALREPRRARILWVDDHPDNNVFVQRALEALDIEVKIARSTDEAVAVLRRERFAAVISDMGRPPDPRAGYTLLSEVRQGGYDGPFYLFAIEGSLEPNRAEARERGAQGSTDRADELIRMVLRSIRSSS